MAEIGKSYLFPYGEELREGILQYERISRDKITGKIVYIRNVLFDTDSIEGEDTGVIYLAVCPNVCEGKVLNVRDVHCLEWRKVEDLKIDLENLDLEPVE